MAQQIERQLRERVEAWIADDPDPGTRIELQALLDGEEEALLREVFGAPMEFGTAGLRGLLGGGPTKMNQVTVARATAGLARQLLEDHGGGTDGSVVVGRDGRRMSPEFARTVAEVLVGYGLKVFWFDDPVPTPVAAFAGRHLGALATVVVTASHNPPEYNGYKVFSRRGSQIVPPQDARIRNQMENAGPTLDLPREHFEQARRSGMIEVLGDELSRAYLGALDSQCMGTLPPEAQVSCVTTALHGVGDPWIKAALEARGFGQIYPVAAQSEPDGLFPTVRFPNPEEEGALVGGASGESQRSEHCQSGPKTHRAALGVALATHQLASYRDVGLDLDTQPRVEHSRRVQVRISMHRTEAKKLGLGEGWDQTKDPTLLTVAKLGLKTDDVEQGSQRVVLSKLDHSEGLFTGARIGQADGLHGPESQGVASAFGHDLYRQATLKVGRIFLPVLECGFLALMQCVDEGIVLRHRHRAVDVGRFIAGGPGLVVA